MERREFIKGLLIGASAAAGTALVKLAEPEEVTALTLGRETLVGHPQPALDGLPETPIGAMVYIRTYRGHDAYQFLPIGFVTRLEIRNESLDVTPSWSGTIVLQPGLMSGEAEFVGPEFGPHGRKYR